MDIFEFRDHLVRDYQSYVRSFIQIRDPRIKAHGDFVLAPVEADAESVREPRYGRHRIQREPDFRVVSVNYDLE